MAKNPKVVGAAVAAIVGGVIFCSAQVLDFLGRWEGEKVYVVYADKLARGLPTVCKGLTKHITDTPIIVGEVWSEAKCDREERRAVEYRVQRPLLKCFLRTPPQSVFDAATSHAWNFGVARTCGSSAMSAWNRGEWRLGCRRIQLSDGGLPVWSSVRTGRIINGKPEYRWVRGLANRRAAERTLCEKDLDA